MFYKPRDVFKDFHDNHWHRCILLCARRSGKTYASAAEVLKRAYNGDDRKEYFWISPLQEQSEANVLGIFQTLDGAGGYIRKYDKTTQKLILSNGATIQLGGARSVSKLRGRSFAGGIFDEFNDIDPAVYTDVVSYALADQNGWCGFLGTTHICNDYRLYRMYKQYEHDPTWYTKMVSCYDNPEAFSEERIQEIHDEQIKFALSNGMSMTQAEQSFNVEFGLDFSFLEEGRPNLTAMFYQELQGLFDSKPTRILESSDSAIVAASTMPKIAVFDISHSASRDYTVATIICETTTSPIVLNIVWEHDKPWQFWFDYLRTTGIRTVALPFDAASVNKETLLSLNQTFKREGFNVIRIKRLLREEQIENCRWLLNECRFSKDSMAGLAHLGMFNDFSNRHGIAQDIASSVMYAGQVARKKHIKLESSERIKANYDNNPFAYNTQASFYGDVLGGE